ncbi:MAG: hypothetical protein JWM93_1106 [Frankiales bacterium]|nr:hypothetical protein [Frankiales bacterium]
MSSWVSRAVRRSADDSGVALVVALALVGIVGVMLLAMTAYTMREIGATGRDRQRSAGVMTAEGKLDKLMADIQNAKPENLPCNSSDVVQNGPDELALTWRIEYRNGTSLLSTCPLASTATVTSAKLIVTSKSKPVNGQTPAIRTMESYLTLTPDYGYLPNAALFADAGMTLSNNGDFYASASGESANLYTNGSLSCANGQSYAGDLNVRGTLTMSGSCRIDGDATVGALGAGAKGTVGGDLYVVSGNVSLSSAMSVGGHVYFSPGFSATWTGCVGDKCKQVSGLTLPSQTFPQIPKTAYTDPQWAAAGFSVISGLPAAMTTCVKGGGSSKWNGPGKWLSDPTGAPSRSTPTIFVTNCNTGVYIDSPVTVLLKTDIAIFSDGPIDLSKIKIKSTNATHHTLYLIQPYNAVASHPCPAASATGISLSQLVEIAPEIETLMYTPCNVVKGNNSSVTGQIFAGGTATISQKLAMTYEEVPVYGVTGGARIKGYQLDIRYKREGTGS